MYTLIIIMNCELFSHIDSVHYDQQFDGLDPLEPTKKILNLCLW